MMFNRRIIRPRERKPPGEMNKTEARYAALLERQKEMGEVVSWRYEAIKFRLAPKTFYTPDFYVVFRDRIEFHEIKGFLEEDAAVKFKVVAEQYPEYKWLMLRLEKNTWHIIMEY